MRVASAARPIPTCSALLRSRVEFWFSMWKDDAGHFVRFRKTRSSPGLIIVSQDLDIGDAIEDLY